MKEFLLPRPIPLEDAYLAFLKLEKRLSPESVAAYHSDLRLVFRHLQTGSGAQNGSSVLNAANLRGFIKALVGGGLPVDSNHFSDNLAAVELQIWLPRLIGPHLTPIC